MHHGRRRLVVDLEAGRAHGEGEVGVLVVGRRVAAVERAEPLEQLAPDRDRGARAVVRFAAEAEARVGRVLEAAVVPARAVVEDDAAGFLQAAVGIDQLGPDQAGLRCLLQTAHQRFEPARGDHRVVVEEQQVFAGGGRGACVARADEAEVLRVAQHADAGDVGQAPRGLVAGAVVDDDDLERDRAGVFGDRAQAGAGVGDLVVDRNHDRHARAVAGRHRERREVVAGLRIGDARLRGAAAAAQLLRDAAHGAGQPALGEAAAHARGEAAQVQGAIGQAGAQCAQAGGGRAQRPGHLPGTAGQERLAIARQQFQVGDGLALPVGLLQQPFLIFVQRAQLRARLDQLAVEPVPPFAAPPAFALGGGQVGAYGAFALARLHEGVFERGLVQRLRAGRGQRIARDGARRQVEQSGVGLCGFRRRRLAFAGEPGAHRVERLAPLRQRVDAGDDRLDVGVDEEAVAAVLDAFGQGADARGDHRQAEAAQLRQDVAEGFRDGRQQ